MLTHFYFLPVKRETWLAAMARMAHMARLYDSHGSHGSLARTLSKLVVQ